MTYTSRKHFVKMKSFLIIHFWPSRAIKINLPSPGVIIRELIIPSEVIRGSQGIMDLFVKSAKLHWRSAQRATAQLFSIRCTSSRYTFYCNRIFIQFGFSFLHFLSNETSNINQIIASPHYYVFTVHESKLLIILRNSHV